MSPLDEFEILLWTPYLNKEHVAFLHLSLSVTANSSHRNPSFFFSDPKALSISQYDQVRLHNQPRIILLQESKTVASWKCNLGAKPYLTFERKLVNAIAKQLHSNLEKNSMNLQKRTDKKKEKYTIGTAYY